MQRFIVDGYRRTFRLGGTEEFNNPDVLNQPDLHSLRTFGLPCYGADLYIMEPHDFWLKFGFSRTFLYLHPKPRALGDAFLLVAEWREGVRFTLPVEGVLRTSCAFKTEDKPRVLELIAYVHRLGRQGELI